MKCFMRVKPGPVIIANEFKVSDSKSWSKVTVVLVVKPSKFIEMDLFKVSVKYHLGCPNILIKAIFGWAIAVVYPSEGIILY